MLLEARFKLRGGSERKNTRDSKMKLNDALMNAFVYASKYIALMLMEMKTSDSQ
jgi:hypothetical protein